MVRRRARGPRRGSGTGAAGRMLTPTEREALTGPMNRSQLLHLFRSEMQPEETLKVYMTLCQNQVVRHSYSTSCWGVTVLDAGRVLTENT